MKSLKKVAKQLVMGMYCTMLVVRASTSSVDQGSFPWLSQTKIL